MSAGQPFRDELAERRARMHSPGAASQRAFHVTPDVTITAIQCPACTGPLFAPSDSHDERVDCPGCDARLVTHRTADGELTALLVTGGAP